MAPQFIRAILSILLVRAIFISPVNGSEFGPPSRLSRACLKRSETTRPSRLRFTKPGAPSTIRERVDCRDGGDDDDRSRPGATRSGRWISARPARSILARLTATRPAQPSSLHLRC